MTPESARPDLTRRTLLIASVVALAAVALLHLTSIPLTIWEFDETMFAMAVEKFQPLIHHPPPPGYPVYIGFAKLVHLLTGPDPWRALIAVNVVALLVGFVVCIAAFRAVSGDGRTAVGGAFLFYVAPAMLVHATVGQSDTGGLALLVASIWAAAALVKSPTWVTGGITGVVCALTVGWRPQLAIAILPLFFVTLFLARSWRARSMALQLFTLVCLGWLATLVLACGGVPEYLNVLTKQAVEFAAHDADLSRGGRSWAEIVLRFIAHGWGPKWLSLPVLGLAAIGGVAAFRSRRRELFPVAVMTVLYLGFAIAMMDPADGARYALPGTLGVALFAAIGLAALRTLTRGVLADWAILLFIGFAAYWYVMPILHQRARTEAPPVAAAEHLRTIAPPDAVVLYDLPLRPHADYLLREFRSTRIDEGLRRFGSRTDLRLFEYVDSTSDEGRVFSWATTDAYGKLTRDHYAVVSVVEIPLNRRFLGTKGVYPPERSRSEAQSWRWLEPRASIALPPLGASTARVTLRLPKDYPLESNDVTLRNESGVAVSASIRRADRTTLTVPVSPGGSRLEISTARSFVPASVPGTLSRDRRNLGVMLVEVEQLIGEPTAASPRPSP
ncbi:MAG: hypothetical protein WA208_07265 [Thermoanaerobaculia bacterium]